MNFRNWSDVGNFPGVREFTSSLVMHLLKSLDNHSDTMQLAIFKNLDGMSLGELFDFILRFLMCNFVQLPLALSGCNTDIGQSDFTYVMLTENQSNNLSGLV